MPNPTDRHEIRLNYVQCSLIHTALSQCKLQGYFGADREMRDEIDMLHACFETLLDCDDDADRVTHDLTL